VRPIDRLEESFAGVVNARSLIAIVDGQLPADDIAKERYVVEVPAGFAARGQRDQSRGDQRRAGRIGDVLAEDGLVVGKNGGEQRLILPSRCRRFLTQSRRTDRRDRDYGREDHTQTNHANPREIAATARLKVRRSG
jgi:hypothetical protein